MPVIYLWLAITSLSFTEIWERSFWSFPQILRELWGFQLLVGVEHIIHCSCKKEDNVRVKIILHIIIWFSCPPAPMSSSSFSSPSSYSSSVKIKRNIGTASSLFLHVDPGRVSFPWLLAYLNVTSSPSQHCLIQGKCHGSHLMWICSNSTCGYKTAQTQQTGWRL